MSIIVLNEVQIAAGYVSVHLGPVSFVTLREPLVEQREDGAERARDRLAA
jgi:hypothetical protein